MSLEVTQRNAWAQGEHDGIRHEMQERFEKVTDMISKDIKKLRAEIARASTDKWKLVSYTLLGAITSAGILGIIDLIKNGHRTLRMSTELPSFAVTQPQ